MKKILYIDMDDTIAIFQKKNCLELMYERGYFENLKPRKLAKTINELAKKYKIIVLSACVNTPYCKKEKINWIGKNIPNVNSYILCNVGENKAKVLKDKGYKIDKNAILIDDYSKNIFQWEENGGTAIKFINNFNNKRGLEYKYSFRNSNKLIKILESL